MKKRNDEEGKQFLKEIRDLDKLIKKLKDQIEIEEARLMDISVHYKDIQIQSSASKNMMEEKCPEIVDLMNQLREEIELLSAKKQLALDIMKHLQPRRQTILLLYYIQGKTLEQTAEEMGKSYKWTWDEMQAAVVDFSKIVKENFKST